jgi:hypothetical protein
MKKYCFILLEKITGVCLLGRYAVKVKGSGSGIIMQNYETWGK